MVLSAYTCFSSYTTSHLCLGQAETHPSCSLMTSHNQRMIEQIAGTSPKDMGKARERDDLCSSKAM